MRIVCYAVLGLCFCGGVRATEISEQQFIQLLKQKHQLTQKAKLKLSIKEVERDGSKAAYHGAKLKIGGALGETYKKTDKNTENFYTHKRRSHIREAYAELSKQLNHGVKVRFKASRALPKQLDENYDEQAFADYDYLAERDNTLSLDFSVALLKNRGGVLDRKTYEIDEMDVDDEKLVIAQEQQAVIYRHLSWFIDWAHYLEQAQIYQQRIQYAEDLIPLAAGQGETDKTLLVLKNEVSRAEQLLARTENKITAIKQKIATSLQDQAVTKRRPKVHWHKKPHLLAKPKDYLKKHSLTLKRIAIAQQINARQTKSYRNEGLAQLDLSFSAERHINKGNHSTYDYQKDTDYEVRLDFSHTFNNPKVKTNLRKARINKQLLQIKYDDTLRDLLADTEELATKIKLNKREIETLEKQKAQTEQEFATEKQNYLDGEIDVRFLLKTQKEWFETRLDYTGALWEYQKHRNSYGYIMK